MSRDLHELGINEQELHLVDRFRQSRNASVLTIMFTDIQGFTRLTEERGDAYSNEVRKAHDGLLVPIIERDGGGRVIKHIGDAVMAVFSEPSTAVARSLEIQETLRRHNIAHTELPPLLVRIGLHMGQVTVEDKVSLDVFGRHVNRASRVEGLADGGHIYLTYSVFDSAKGWMMGRNKEVAWISHGHYRVKGIDEALEIFEVHDPRVKPRAPQNAKRHAAFPKWLVPLGIFFVGLILLTAALLFKGVLSSFFPFHQKNPRTETAKPTPTNVVIQTSVNFEDLGIPADIDLILDHKTRLQLDGNPRDHLRKSLTTISPGTHLLHYDVSPVSRYYSPVQIASGENVIRPRFKDYDLPRLTANSIFQANGKNENTFSNRSDYTIFDESAVPRDHVAGITLTTRASKGDKANALIWDLSWLVTLDEKKISAESLRIQHDASQTEHIGSEKKILWRDARHYYYLTYHLLAGTSIQVELWSEYIVVK